MTKEELLNLPIGKFKLTDEINNFQYDLLITLTNDNMKIFRIILSGYPEFSDSITFHQYIEIDEDGNQINKLSVSAGIGALIIHTDDSYSILRQIKLK